MPTYNLPQLNQCDHCVLSFLHPYLMREPNRLVISQLHQLLGHFRGTLNSGGVISLSKDGNVKFITQQAEQLLKQYFPITTFEENSLPSHLINWFKFEVSQLQGDDPYFCHTFQIEQGEQQLKIHFVSEQIGGDYHLLLEERKKSTFSVDDLKSLGLTQREAEILFWVSRDKANPDIAKAVGIAEGTVRKHLEHIYKNTSVES